MKAIPIINENSFMMAKSISTNLNIYAQSSLWKQRKKIILHSTSYPRALLSFSTRLVISNKNRRENKEVLKINRNFSLAFTWDPLCQRAEKKSFNDNWSIWAVITMSLEKHYGDDEEVWDEMDWSWEGGRWSWKAGNQIEFWSRKNIVPICCWKV